MKKVIVFLRKIFFALRSAEQGTRRRQKAERIANTTETLHVKPKDDLLLQVEEFLGKHYQFRFNQITETTEYRKQSAQKSTFTAVNQRELNSFCIAARKHGIECWDRDISRFVQSADIPSFHPFLHYMNELPSWDGIDRLEELARRVSDNPLWIKGFCRWMLSMSAQWMGMESLHANSVAPVLVSRRQGMHKSTFCKLLIPDVLQPYYTDSFDLASVSASEQKLTVFGLINLDEMDKYSSRKMTLLKNLMQMAGLNIRKAYKKNYSQLPRIASFIGTSNQKELLTDPTGSRRFLCVEVMNKIDCSPINYAQLYAQLKTLLTTGTRYWFTGEEETKIMQSNKAFQKWGMEQDVFFSCYRVPEDDEASILLSGACIFKELKKRNPAAMRDSSPLQFSRTLTALGIERIHTEMGNRYRVVPVA